MNKCKWPEIPILDPAFRFLPGNHDLLPDPPDQAMLDLLSYSVARSPGDLISHTRRILLSKARGDADQTFGALVDLFIAVGPKGQSLRRNMLQRCLDVITAEQQAWLQQHIEQGLFPADVSNCPHSRLAAGHRGGLPADAFYQ